MRPTARVSLRRFLTAGVLLLTIPMMLSGCIVCIEDPHCGPRPRMATLQVYALDYYTGVLGESAYVEGSSTRGWRIGDSWLTLFPGGDGAPRNTEINLVMATPAEAERLHAALIAAGGQGEPPSDQLMYEPIRYCPVTDPFGTDLLIYARL